MASRAEITAKYARGYRSGSKKDKGRLLDEVVAVTGWSREGARRRLAAAARPRPAGPRRRHRSRKYSMEALKVLQRVWAFSSGECGKYLAASMNVLVDALERHVKWLYRRRLAIKGQAGVKRRSQQCWRRRRRRSSPTGTTPK